MTSAEEERQDVIAYLRYLEREGPPKRSWHREVGKAPGLTKREATIRDIKDGLHKNPAYQR